MHRRSRFLLLAVLLTVGCQLDAAVTLPHLISDHMMLQAGVPARIWGKAAPGEAVTVRFQGQSASTKAAADGAWQVSLAPLKETGPSDLRIDGENSITVRDVLVGEVWVASGQSNMAWPVQRTNNAEQELAAANYPQIRILKVPMKTADQPVDDVDAEWQPVTPESIKAFSAVAYFFARHLHDKLHKPIGIIQSAWGGTPAESWTSMEALKAEPALSFYLENWDGYLSDYPAEKLRYEHRLRDWEAMAKTLTNGEAQRSKPQPPRGPGHQHAPATLYNAMIAPLTPYAIRGAIWYQGESNANIIQASRYRKLFETMIIDWRNHWGQGDFPFLFVQLANYANTGDQSGWPELRESQLKTLELKNAGMAVTIDIGESQDIHPRNKQDVGLRLGLAARSIAYGEKLIYSGPIYRQMTIENGKLRVWFDHVGGGLGIDGGDDLKGFTIAGSDREFVPAKAEIDGETVVVSNPNVADPLAVRYAWADDPVNNLINAEGLPASPFRTDNWRNARMAK